MDTSTWFIISAIVSLISILITYFDITRYITLHFSSLRKHIESYQQLPDASSNDRVVVVTSGHDKLETTVKSLLDQTVKVDEMSATPKLGEYNLPESLKDVLKPLKAGKGYVGCQTLMLAVLCTKLDKTMILWAKPGYVYGKTSIATMVEKASEHPSKPIVSSCGRMAIVRPSHFTADTNSESCSIEDVTELIRNNCGDGDPVIVHLAETYPAMK